MDDVTCDVTEEMSETEESEESRKSRKQKSNNRKNIYRKVKWGHEREMSRFHGKRKSIGVMTECGRFGRGEGSITKDTAVSWCCLPGWGRSSCQRRGRRVRFWGRASDVHSDRCSWTWHTHCCCDVLFVTCGNLHLKHSLWVANSLAHFQHLTVTVGDLVTGNGPMPTSWKNANHQPV